jgi:uncharacterized membrane-anchored protein
VAARATKLPAIVAAFWVTKIVATTLGETGGDLLSMKLDLGYATASLIFLGFFGVTLVLQLLARRYDPPLYWAVIVATSTAGTTMSDYMDRTLELGYASGSLLLVSILALILAVWRAVEGTLAVDRIASRRAEVFYWAAILFSNTLGTALGDFLAHDSDLGFAGGVLLIGGLLALVLVATRFTRLPRVLLFWVAFVLTRPFGATLGDVLTKPGDEGGLDFGAAGSSAVLAAALVALVVREVAVARRAAAAPSAR